MPRTRKQATTIVTTMVSTDGELTYKPYALPIPLVCANCNQAIDPLFFHNYLGGGRVIHTVCPKPSLEPEPD